jgi:bacterioferritin-associated ferredoxin
LKVILKISIFGAHDAAEKGVTLDVTSAGVPAMIVCHCAGVTDRTITEVVHAGATTVEDIVRRTGAGRCCAPCRDEIRALLSAAAQPAAG